MHEPAVKDVAASVRVLFEGFAFWWCSQSVRIPMFCEQFQMEHGKDYNRHFFDSGELCRAQEVAQCSDNVALSD